MKRQSFFAKMNGDKDMFTYLTGGFLVIPISVYLFFFIEDPLLSYVGVGFGILFLVIGLWRSYNLNAFFDDGVLADGEITDIHFSRGKAHLKITYIYKEIQYTVKVQVLINRYTKVYIKGSKITLVIHPVKHKKVIIYDLFEQLES